MASKAKNIGIMGVMPGMDFVQNLFKAAPGIAQSLPPSITQWIAPTTSVEEIDKKITDLKAVQAWLETNASMLKATVQALEVQRMTLSTLKSMKINLTDVPGYAMGAAKEAASEIKEKPLDPMQWWGALSKQMTQPFAQLDTKAMQEMTKRATKAVAKGAASAAASKVAAGAAGAAVDAAFGMANKTFNKGFKAAGSVTKGALDVALPRTQAKRVTSNIASNTAKKITKIADNNSGKRAATHKSSSKR